MSQIFETIQRHCEAKPNAYEDHPWGDTVWKVKPKGKIFCFGGQTSMTVRATLDEQAVWIQMEGITPAPYLARHGWIAVNLESEQNRGLALELIDRSYELVTGPSKSKR